MRRRNMFNLTGQPGWMRFSYSPGWIGRSATGLGPCAQILMSGDQLPFQNTQTTINSESRLDFLKNQMSILENQLSEIKSQINAIEGGNSK